MLKILNTFYNLWVSRFYFLLLFPFIFVKTPKTKKVLNKRRSVFRLQYFRNSCCFLYIYLPRMNVSICGRKRYSGKPANIWYTTNLLMLGIKMWRRDLYGKQRKNTFWSHILFFIQTYFFQIFPSSNNANTEIVIKSTFTLVSSRIFRIEKYKIQKEYKKRN